VILSLAGEKGRGVCLESLGVQRARKKKVSRERGGPHCYLGEGEEKYHLSVKKNDVLTRARARKKTYSKDKGSTGYHLQSPEREEIARETKHYRWQEGGEKLHAASGND